jgi:hypothetical protein
MTFRNSTRLGFVNNQQGTLSNATSKYLLRYNHSLGRFDLVSSDDLIASATTDNDGDALPDAFIDQIETQIDVGNIDRNYDAGSF